MRTIRRQSIQTILVLMLGVTLGFVLRLFIFTAYLTPDEIGLLTVLLDAANLFAALIPLGSQNIFVRYFPYFTDYKKPEGLLFLGLSLTLIGFSVFAIMFFIFQSQLISYFSQRAGLLSDYISYLIPLVLVRVIFIVGTAYLRALKKTVFPTIIKEIIVRILTGVLVLSFSIKWFDIDGLVFWFVIIYFISGAIMTYYIFHLGHLNLKSNFNKLRKGKSKEIISYGLFAVMSNAGGIIIKNIDSLMIASLRSLNDAGVYSIAFFIGLIVEMPRRAVSQITAPFISEAYEKNDMQKISLLYHKSSINQFLIGIIILICVWVNVDNLFQIIPNGERFIDGKYVVLFIGLGKLFDISMGINNEIIQNSKRYRFNFYTTSLFGILGIVSNLILIPMLGILGAAIASMILIIFINVIKVIFVQKKFGLQPFRKNSILAVFVTSVVYAIASLIPEFKSPLMDIFCRSIIAIISFFGLVLTLKVSEDLNLLFDQILRRLNKFRRLPE